MKTADANRQASHEEWPGEIDRARKLIALYADKTDQRPAA
jgi:hypothetical protein